MQFPTFFGVLDREGILSKMPPVGFFYFCFEAPDFTHLLSISKLVKNDEYHISVINFVSLITVAQRIYEYCFVDSSHTLIVISN